MLSQVVELIEKKDRFAITSHVRPDGDGLGSSLGLFWLLRSLNKDVEVIMRDPAPHSYQQLPGAGTIRVAPRVGEQFDAVFVIECSDLDRPGLDDLGQQLVVNIDHHSTTELFGSINWIDSTAAACGEMVYNLCKATGVRVTKETSPGVYRTSLRSKGDVNVARIAEQFGGGGHRNAAGCTLKGTSSEIEQKVVPLLQDAVKRSNGLKDFTEDALIESEPPAVA